MPHLLSTDPRALLTYTHQERTSPSFYIGGPSGRAQTPPKFTPPHLRTVTVTTRKSAVIPAYEAMSVVLGEQKAAICQNYRAQTRSAHKTVNNYHFTVQPDMKRSQLASIELLDGVSNVDGKRWVSASMKETGEGGRRHR